MFPDWESLANQGKRIEEAIVFQNIVKNVKKVFVQILTSDFELTKSETLEEIFLSFHTQIFQ